MIIQNVQNFTGSDFPLVRALLFRSRAKVLGRKVGTAVNPLGKVERS